MRLKGDGDADDTDDVRVVAIRLIMMMLTAMEWWGGSCLHG
jgi:hypothetical protein